ncbi:hypothetical protein [Legionella londiniensis]|uniref:Transmembrane protein n=1 Tax=Legionella londiniensis TaxID=45068 RepID=A0A0W0VJE0_9GAMM|nr:hypothetical protein [Legionella londiniensis]KTD19897.1 hypothetical protein Llon_2069 [Legionella londiniensis]STX94231.1 Uncharacterised protein [Legionella londiniensis]
MITSLLILGIFVIIIGGMLIFTPHLLEKINAYLSKKIFTDKDVFAHRLVVAVIFIASGIWFILTYVYYA